MTPSRSNLWIYSATAFANSSIAGPSLPRAAISQCNLNRKEIGYVTRPVWKRKGQKRRYLASKVLGSHRRTRGRCWTSRGSRQRRGCESLNVAGKSYGETERRHGHYQGRKPDLL